MNPRYPSGYSGFQDHRHSPSFRLDISPECERFPVRRHAAWPGVTGRVTVAEHAAVVVYLIAGLVGAGTTKNGEGRVFPLTSELRRVLEDQQQAAEQLKREHGTIVRHVFCYTTGQKAGQRITESGFNKAWRKVSPLRTPPVNGQG